MVGRIESLSNDKVRRVQALLRSTRRRHREGLLVAEGVRLVREAVVAELPLTWCFYTADFAATAVGGALVERIAMAGEGALWEVTPEVLAALTDTETPQGVVVVMPTPVLPAPDAPAVTLILDGVRDPGNLGTILRTAWAAGVSQVLLPPGAVDPTNPKVVRAGMGAHFHVPIRRCGWDEICAEVAGASVWLAAADGATLYDAVDWRGRVALIMGGEAEGAGPEARALAGSRRVMIPMAPGVESLNAAVATAILLFEMARQRRH